MSSRLNILFVLPSPHNIGGVARSAQRLSASFQRCGHSVCFVYPDPDLFPGERGIDDNSWRFHHDGGMQQFSSEVYQAICSKKPNVVLGWYVSSAGCAAVSAASLSKIPVVVAARGNDIDLDFFDPQKHSLLAWTIQNAHAITTVSTDMAHKIRSWFGKDAHFISNSVDTAVFYPEEAQAKLFLAGHNIRNKPVLGLFGEFKPKRGLELLSRIAHEIQHWQPVLVGHIRSNVAHLVPPHAICIPYLHNDAQLRGAYAACDVIIQPSLYDGMPNVVLEALACGRPVLSSRAGGLADIGFLHTNTQICNHDEDWVQSLQQIRRGTYSFKPVSLPTPEQEAEQFLEIFYRRIC